MSTALFSSVRSVAGNRRGVTSAEYAILAVGIVVIVGAAATAFGPDLAQVFRNIAAQITAAQQNAVDNVNN
jgi:Flp pilus assembly pilin Flp